MSLAHPQGPTKPSRARTVAIPILTAAVLGGCASEPPPPPDTGPAPVRHDPRPSAAGLLTEVLDNVSEQGSARAEVHGDLGVVGKVNGASALHFDQTGSDIAMRGETKAGGQPQPVQLSVVDDVGYLQTPLARPESGKDWLRITPQGEDFTAALLSPALRQLHDAVDPRATFAEVTDASRIQDSAQEDVDGTPATRYDLRIDTKQAADQATDPQRAEQFQRAADAGKGELGYRLWVDADGLPLRFSTSPNIAQPGQQGANDATLTSTYSGWSEPVDISTPPPHEVGRLEQTPPQAQPPR